MEDLARQQTRQELERRCLPVAHQNVEILDRGRAGLLQRLLELSIGAERLEADLVPSQLLLEKGLPLLHHLISLVDVEPVPDLVAGVRRLDEAQPVPARLLR